MKTHRWIVTVSMFGVREEHIIYRGEVMKFIREMKNLNKNFHVYSMVMIPIVIRS